MKRVLFLNAAALFIAILAITPHQVAVADTVEELKQCARTENSTARVACYEALGSRVLAEEQVPEESVPEESVLEAPVTSLPDDLGGRDFANDDKHQPDRGFVESCRQGADKKWFYTFDNGQVWKQSGGRRIRHKECQFYVTITKDGFGYKMQIDGEKGKIRINRKR